MNKFELLKSLENSLIEAVKLNLLDPKTRLMYASDTVNLLADIIAMYDIGYSRFDVDDFKQICITVYRLEKDRFVKQGIVAYDMICEKSVVLFEAN